MICVEKRLGELFAVLPNVSDYKPVYGYGSEEDLAKHIKYLNEQQVMAYPLIWLLTPIQCKGENPIESNISLVLSVRSNATAMNDKRVEDAVLPILFPLLDNIKKALRQSGFSGIKNPESSTYTNYFNYEAPTEIWDAVKFDCTISMNDCKQKIIHF